MVKIIYGVNGEGLGHATRSKPIIEGLLKKHEIKIVAGRRAYEYLSKKFEVKKIYAFDIVYKKNEVALFETIIKNFLLFPFFGLVSIIRIFLTMRKFRPDVVITDFEPLTYLVAKLLRIPIISIDNQHILTNCKIRFSKKFFLDYIISKIVTVLFTGFSTYFIITTFFYPAITKKRTYLVAPILRKKIIKLKPKTGRHIIVYQTSGSYKTLLPILKQLKKEEFRIYKADREGKEGNIIFRKFNETEFLKDLATCKAVITNGGFSLITEAVYLDKPILSVPVKKQFEQILNSIHVSLAGFGEHHEDINSIILKKFLKNLPNYKKKLRAHHETGNEEVVRKIEEIIAIQKQ